MCLDRQSIISNTQRPLQHLDGVIIKNMFQSVIFFYNIHFKLGKKVMLSSTGFLEIKKNNVHYLITSKYNLFKLTLIFP